MRRLAGLAVLVLALVGSTRAAAGQFRSTAEPLQPATYVSASGSWSLDVDPTQRFGAGPADCRMRRDGEEVWAERLPLTLRDARVDDEGYVAGYGYSGGWSGSSGKGEFFLALISPAGELITRHDEPVTYNRFFHDTDDPRVGGLVLDPEHGRVVVRIYDADFNRGREQWRVLDLHSGAITASYRPAELAGFEQEESSSVWAVKPLPTLPLVAVYWWITRRNSTASDDVRVTLMDLEGRTVWTRDFEKELEVEDENGDSWPMWSRLREVGPLRDVAPGGRFSAWLPRSGQRVDFRVTRGDEEGTWRCEEIGRGPFTAPHTSPAATPDPPVEEIVLERLGEATLQAGEAGDRSPIRDIDAFGFDAAGHLMAVRCDDREAKRYSAMLVEPSGEVLVEQRFEPLEPAEDGEVGWWPFEDGRWLVTCSPWGPGKTSQAWWADPRTGSIQPLPAWELPSVESLVSTRDGHLAVLATSPTEDMTSVLARCDASGRVLWSIVEDNSYSDRSEMLCPDDLAVDVDGALLVADPVRDLLQVFSADGDWLENIDLADAWGETQAPQYPAGVRANARGDLVVIDSGTANPVRRVDADGNLLAALDPRLEDGSKDRSLCYSVHVAPDGRLWTTDGRVLLRLGEDGVADLTLGAKASPEALEEPGWALMDGSGRIVIRDRRTDVLHAFARDGRRLFTAVPAPEDFQNGGWSSDPLACGGDGSLYEQARGGTWVHFDRWGERLGVVDLGVGELAFVPGSHRFWTRDVESAQGGAVLLDPARGELTRFERRLDGRWFHFLSALAVSPSGEVAAFERGAETCALSLVSPEGKPLELFDLPSSTLCSDLVHGGRWIVCTVWDGSVLLVRREDGALRRFSPPLGKADAEHPPTVGISPDGSELWVLEVASLHLTRYALP